MYLCPVCGYDELDELPYVNNDVTTGSFEICSCCGFQFGVDDLDNGISLKKYRDKWVDEGAKWYSDSSPKPKDWNLEKQLLNIIT
ncbi:hypothetical protein ACFSTH_09385 [Paenibacillus yanchengensis]|uniref:Transcription factor zinc-finger domain-containing protein n=1 Tax=Paenibacillus yanchengensis TaxID=2035833 RepID=A0ABW4YPK2_9BACL